MNMKRNRGFTMIELLAVLALLAIVIGVVATNIGGQADKGKASAAKIEMQQISQSLDLFKLEVGRYPTSAEGLQALVANPGAQNWNGPYLKKSSVPKDPWNNDYKYVSPAPNGPFEIISMGADGKDGGSGADADISSAK